MVLHETIYGDNEPLEAWVCVRLVSGRFFLESYGTNKILLCPWTQNGAHSELCGLWHATRLVDRQQPEREDTMDPRTARHDVLSAMWHFSMRMWDEAMQEPSEMLDDLLENHREALLVLLGDSDGT